MIVGAALRGRPIGGPLDTPDFKWRDRLPYFVRAEKWNEWGGHGVPPLQWLETRPLPKNLSGAESTQAVTSTRVKSLESKDS
jgi:hypothetical protein